MALLKAIRRVCVNSRKRRICLVILVCLGCVVFSSLFSRDRVNRVRHVLPLRQVTRSSTQQMHSSHGASAGVLFKHKPLTIWSSNFHPTPVIDIKHLLEPLGVRFIVKDLSSKYCEHFNTCSSEGQPVRVISKDNILAMNYHRRLISEFYAAYRDDAEMRSVDAFLCCDPPGACEIFEPFKKSLLIVATTRYNIGRSNTLRWTELNHKMVKASRRPSNIIAANNRYDQEYIRYFTGIDPILLPSTCDYTATSYAPTRPGFLLALRPRDPQLFQETFLKQFWATCSKLAVNVQLFAIRQLYADYKYSDLAAHRGIIHLPYQVSVMAMLEQYRMNIPLFFPSKELLVEWNRRWFVLHERSESPPPPVNYTRKPLRRSNVRAHWTQRQRPDPNNDRNRDAISYWLQYADYYAMPYVVYFNSTEHLAVMLNTITDQQLASISNSMAEYNDKSRHEVMDKWRNILLTIANYSANQPR